MTEPSAWSQKRISGGIFLLSVATLAFEINLTRLFAVAQFYHFAFMIVSLALLGFGASGSFLALFPRLHKDRPTRILRWSGWGFALTAVGSYLLTLYLPFDSFQVAYDWRQSIVLVLHYLALALPFFCSGTVVGSSLAAQPGHSSRIYAINLAGSAAGCLLAMTMPSWVGAEGMVMIAAVLGMAAALTFPDHARSKRGLLFDLLASVLTFLCVCAAVVRPDWVQIKLSPYKSLSYTLLYPDAELIWRRWNSFSRVDVVRSTSIRSLPGRGFRCTDMPPPQRGLTVDGDDLSPISQVAPGFDGLPFTGCLLVALPYRLRPHARALVLEPRGGLDVLVALGEGARSVTAVEANPLVVQAVRQQGAWAGRLYDDPRVNLVAEEGRTYARRGRERYEVIVLSLTSPQRAVVSGAYSLVEDYRYTVQAFADYISRLEEGGLLAVMRWQQVPPSESVRAFALAVAAVEQTGGNPKTDIVALRSYQQIFILIRRGAFTQNELADVRAFAAPRAFDLVYLPDVQEKEVNRYNILPEPEDYRACVGLLNAEDKAAWYRAYAFDVSPPTDDRPFFGHFFKWRQAPDVLAMAGHTWQPFGGAGYFVLLALLALALVSAGVLIVLPLAVLGKSRPGHGHALSAALIYFALLGLGYLCVEIPIIQRFILFLGHPTYAMATVLLALLLFSGIGSLISPRLPLQWVLISLPVMVGAYALGLPVLFKATLAAPLAGRLLLSILALAPLGMCMGMPFPQGIALLQHRGSTLVAWAWGSNGAASVVASVLAALLALSWGFPAVLAVGALCYLGAWITARFSGWGSPAVLSPHR